MAKQVWIENGIIVFYGNRAGYVREGYAVADPVFHTSELEGFLKKQGQLFDEPVAETLEEAEAFLEDCMAVVVENIDEVKEFLEEEGMDIQGMSDEELEEAAEVFPIPDGRYLIVEG